MSRQIFVEGLHVEDYPYGITEAQAMEQNNELYALRRAKEILTDLERQGRITTGLREQGVIALSAAIKAVEHPYMRNLGTQAGLRASTEQYEAQQRGKNREF